MKYRIKSYEDIQRIVEPKHSWVDALEKHCGSVIEGEVTQQMSAGTMQPFVFGRLWYWHIDFLIPDPEYIDFFNKL